jgi:hypothetical protein
MFFRDEHSLHPPDASDIGVTIAVAFAVSRPKLSRGSTVSNPGLAAVAQELSPAAFDFFTSSFDTKIVEQAKGLLHKAGKCFEINVE